MPSLARELLTVDRQRLDLHAGLLGLAVLSVFGVAIAIWGPVAIASAIGALVLLAADPPPAGRPWAAALLPLVVGGAVLTCIAVWIAGRPVPAAVLVGVVGVVAALHAGRSRNAGIRALIATIWIVVALTLYDTGVDALHYAAAFAVGAAAGALVAWFRSRADSGEGVGADDVEAGTTSHPRPQGLFTSPLGQFALLRGLGLAVAVLLGFTLFPAHPAWVAVTALIVMRPPTRKALTVGLQRSLGTGVGVVVAVAVAGLVGENMPGLVILFLLTAFLTMAFREVNYALFAMFVTALVVYSQRILGADAAESGQDRLVETILGVTIAFIVLGLAEALAHARNGAA